ncbi:MAG: phosphoribosylformylglycinamidine synthase [Bacteroidales bacterium]
MILFFRTEQSTVIAVKSGRSLSQENINALKWLFNNAEPVNAANLSGRFVGPRREMITPWSTTAVEITQNMNMEGIERIEEFFPVQTEACAKENGTADTSNAEVECDKMLQRIYTGLDQEIFTINKQPEPVIYIDDFEAYNKQEGLALNSEEIEYLKGISKKIGRGLTDSEVFGFSQVNSEHCRHKIFNGVFIIDGKEMESSLFKMIKKTSQENPNLIVSAYKDNCAFVDGPQINLFHPASGSKPDFYITENEKTVISLKAETHNFPTTVEPFNGAATGSGGEIRDRMAGGKGSFPIAGTACYMASYPRFCNGVEATAGINHKLNTSSAAFTNLEDQSCAAAMKVERDWEKTPAREWLYQSPQEILTKASNGASDFGNKFGQCIICGSVLTAEYNGTTKFGYDKVIMLAGGVGYAKKRDALKDKPAVGDKVVLLGGDNYRIGMGGGAVSSVNTGQYANAIELNAIQRSNPEMQKRAYNAIRSLAESSNNTIISVHDHGAGGHLNCLSELVEETGGTIDISKLPVGDPTLSLKEIIGNESQERMGLVIKESDVAELRAIAERERAPMYVIGETTGKHNFTLRNEKTGEAAIDMAMEDMFGSAPKTYMEDKTADYKFAPLAYDVHKFEYYLTQVLQLESVACKDWLTNKVDRSVTGLIAGQQTTGEIQLPLNNLGATAIGYNNKEGIATSMGHAPLVALADSAAGSRMAIAEALTNVVWAPLNGGLKSISLSANWMWPCRNEGEDARLYKAVKGASDFACALGINIPTGKDSMSMTQKYPNGEKVLSPGTLIISTVAPVSDINGIVNPNLKTDPDSSLVYVPFSGLNNRKESYPLGGSAFAQIMNKIGNQTPDIHDPAYFGTCFTAIQELVNKGLILAGHDISAGGLITTALEMCFANTHGGLTMNACVLEMLAQIAEAQNGTKCFECTGKKTEDLVFRAMFSEVPGVLLQVANNKLEEIGSVLNMITAPTVSECNTVRAKGYMIGNYLPDRKLVITGMGEIAGNATGAVSLDIDALRDIWYKTSYLFDIRQVGEKCARDRFQNYKNQPLIYKFPTTFTGKLSDYKGAMDGKTANLVLTSGAIAATTPIAAIIREKGSNGDREMAWALHMAGFRVKDVHMTDLITGRETLEEIKLIVFVGGFANADTLGSAKGWAGAFLYNEKAKRALDHFYARKDTLSLGICNGCQLMAELGLITPDNRELSPKMKHNNSHKYEAGFVGIQIEESPAVMLKSLSGSKLGIWVAHGEGKFSFPAQEAAGFTFDSMAGKGSASAANGNGFAANSNASAANGNGFAANAPASKQPYTWNDFKVAARYAYDGYPANPNGSPQAIAAICSTDGRHLAMMPHPERCLRPWNWPHYPVARVSHEVTPWIEMFINARTY